MLDYHSLNKGITTVSQLTNLLSITFYYLVKQGMNSQQVIFQEQVNPKKHLFRPAKTVHITI